MSTKHTPGPWYFRTNRHPETDGRAWGWVDAAPPGGPQKPIPGVRVEWTRGETSEANARLVAAAPSLLASVQAAKAFCDARGGSWADLEATLRAAIAKATGEQS